MRHGRFFDVIESMCRPIIGLQMRPSLTYFRGWVQKLLSCKVELLKNGLLDPFGGNRAARPILSIGPWLTQMRRCRTQIVHQHIAQCATDRFSILLNPCVGLLLGYKWSPFWWISEAGCKSYWAANAERPELLNPLPAAAPPALSYLLNPDLPKNNFLKNYSRAPL